LRLCLRQKSVFWNNSALNICYLCDVLFSILFTCFSLCFYINCISLWCAHLSLAPHYELIFLNSSYVGSCIGLIPWHHFSFFYIIGICFIWLPVWGFSLNHETVWSYEFTLPVWALNYSSLVLINTKKLINYAALQPVWWRVEPGFMLATTICMLLIHIKKVILEILPIHFR
jgi:hypothetical protein